MKIVCPQCERSVTPLKYMPRRGRCYECRAASQALNRYWRDRGIPLKKEPRVWIRRYETAA